MQRPEIRSRIDEIRNEISEKAILSLVEKRDILRQMAEGLIPTKRFDKTTGKTHDYLAAVIADAKIAGEVGRKEAIAGSLPFKLEFNIPHRDALDGDVKALGNGF